MPTNVINKEDLLDVVKKMPPAEFESFLERALSVRSETKNATLTAAETKLIKRINRGLPTAMCRRYDRLITRRKKGTLTSEEHRELLDLTHQAESRDAERAAALVELAKLRRVPVRALMKQMGIQAPPIHG
jgi:hypothetical protein